MESKTVELFRLDAQVSIHILLRLCAAEDKKKREIRLQFAVCVLDMA